MRNKLLVVDDENLNRELLKQIFESDYEVIEAENGKAAIQAIKTYPDEIAVVLLDLMMTNVNGYQVLQVMNANKMTDVIPTIIITANTDMQIALSCYSLGAVDIINKPFMAQIVRRRVQNIVELFRKQEKQAETLQSISHQLNEKERQLSEFSSRLIEVVSNLVEFRNLESGIHIKRVKGLTLIVAQTYMTLYPDGGLNDNDIDVIVQASVLHDIGKLAIPDNILLKPGKLTDEEREIMQGHTTKGCEILNLLEDVQDSKQFKTAYEICRHHHERYDGSGYPDGLREDEIPLSAQLVALADVYDALVSDRVYKRALTKSEAYEMIMRGDCGAFPPKILKCFEVGRQSIELFCDTHQ